MESEEDRVTRLGLLGLAPLVVGAAAVWLSPWLLPGGVGFDLGEIALIYAGIIAAYLAGVGAGGAIARGVRAPSEILPGIVAALVAWFAIWPVGVFYIPMNDVVRHVLVIGVYVYLLLRDQRAVAANELPAWYGALRMRLTFWACLSLALIVSRLLI